MTNQNDSLPNEVNQQNEAINIETIKAGVPLEERGRRHRSSRHREQAKIQQTRSSARQRSKKRGRNSTKTNAGGRIMTACWLLGCILFFAGGFYCGGKKYLHAESSNPKELTQEAVFPLPQADNLLDTAFSALHDGRYRDAMLNFQKVQDMQAALVGIDYLIAESAYKAGENALAEEAANHALSKNESIEAAHSLLALINLGKTKSVEQDVQQFADPNVTAENEIKQLIATHLDDAKAYALWGDFLRSGGKYRTGSEILHKGVLRADPVQSRELLSAKEQLARLQNEPAKTIPSLSEMTSMTGEQAIAAALASLQLKQSEEAVLFLERARDLFSPHVFRELMNDVAFAEYRSDSRVKQFFKMEHH